MTTTPPPPKFPVGTKVQSVEVVMVPQFGIWYAKVTRADYNPNIPGNYVYQTLGRWVKPGKRPSKRLTVRQLWEQHLAMMES